MPYTSGPWDVETPMGDESPWIVQAGKPTHEWRCIAMLDGDDIPMLEMEANCRLIAAAPDLLVALEGLLPADWRDGVMEHIPGVKAACLAIAKARGKNP